MSAASAIKRFATRLLLGAVLLFLASCQKDTASLDLFRIYELSFSDDVKNAAPVDSGGVVVFSSIHPKGRLEGLFYRDTGAVYADTVRVTAFWKRGAFRMRFPDGRVRAFSCRPYEAPPFEDRPAVKAYHDPSYGVRVEKDVVYGRASGFWTSYPPVGNQRFSKIYFDRAGELTRKRDCPLTLDVYLPEDSGVRPRPLFVMIHGGAFYNGDKAEPEFEGWCRYFASLGYVAASINYRMGFRLLSDEVERAGYRALQDASAAVRFLVSQERYGVDPQRVFVAGTSAGAITALNLAFMREKDRPKSSRGGVVGDILGLFGSNPVDEGPIDKINPQDTASFRIRAVGNMWGALSDLSLLGNDNVSIISFHSKNDPIVPYGYDHPFRILFKDKPFEPLNGVVFSKMYGSSMIDQRARTLGYRTQLYTYTEPAHALHQDPEGNLTPHFYEFEHLMADFFSAEMEDDPVRVHLESGQWIRVGSKAAGSLSWRVEGGLIRETAPDGIRILLFPDASSHRITLTGTYPSGTTFREEMVL